MQTQKTLENPKKLGGYDGNWMNDWSSRHLTSLNKMCAKR